MAGLFHEINSPTLSEVIVTNEEEQRNGQKESVLWDCLWGDQMDCILLFQHEICD